jgi:hypothetical protein
MKTIISHFFNEEYLLPFWLEHHASLFDHGIMIDYHSTDRSVEIIRQMCPSWTILTTKNETFDAILVDEEVNEVEKTITGFKLCLNTTEFFIPLYKGPLQDVLYRIPIASMISTRTHPTTLKEFLDVDLEIRHDRGCRTLHCKPFLRYKPGRHHIEDGQGTVVMTNFIILWCDLYPYNEAFIKRKLQIQQNMSERDKQWGHGIQHLIDAEGLEKRFRENKR